MTFDHYYSSKEWKKTVPDATAETENSQGYLDCNICLDFAHEPVVTLCGHLYCWPCIYKWLHVQSASLAPDEHPQCPVCKANISHTTMVPLYGRGNGDCIGKASHRDILVPPRPAASGTLSLLATSSEWSAASLSQSLSGSSTLQPLSRGGWHITSAQSWCLHDTRVPSPYGWDVWGDVLCQSLWQLGKFVCEPEFLSRNGE